MISFRARKLSTLLSSTFFKNWKGQKILRWYVNLFTSNVLLLTVLTQIIFFNIGNTHFVWLKLFLFWGVRLLIALQMYSITVRLHQFNILIWPTSSYFNKTIEIIFLISRSIFFFVFFPALFKVSNLFYFNINKINIEKNIFFCLNLFIYDKKINFIL